VRNFLLKPTDTLRAAMQRVSKNGAGFAAVVDEKRKWLGTFHDADGRMAMLRGASLDEPVSSFTTRAKDHFVLDNGVVKDVVHFPRPAMDAVVMAGGKGTRLRSLSGNVPKPLLTLGSSTIVERILDNIDAENVWVSVNYRAAMFRKRLGDRVTYIEEQTPLGNAGALSLVPSKGAPYVFITNADLITNVNYQLMLDYHRAHNASITMACASFSTTLKYGVVRASKRGVLDGFEEKPVKTYLCNAGMYIVDRPVLKLVPKGKFFQMPDLIEAVQKRGEDVRVFPLWEKWVDAGSPEEFQQVLIEFARGEES
jgi:NDP-sugar pyrophosphorylase family protein